MKVGDIIGAGDGTEISLTCEVTSIEGSVVEAWVINGHWDITFHLDNRPTICHAPDGPTKIRAKIMTTFPIPPGLNYNKQIEYMNKEFSKTPWARYFTGRMLRVQVFVGRITTACTSAVVAFKNSWQGTPEVGDDDIPF